MININNQDNNKSLFVSINIITKVYILLLVNNNQNNNKSFFHNYSIHPGEPSDCWADLKAIKLLTSFFHDNIVE